MTGGSKLDPGGAYLLDDFTVVQVVRISGSIVHYRIRAGVWRPRIATRTARLARFNARIRAEVNGEFFPELARPGSHTFQRKAAEADDLAAYLAQHAARRPFAGAK